jgi:hypothetical protein
VIPHSFMVVGLIWLVLACQIGPGRRRLAKVGIKK